MMTGWEEFDVDASAKGELVRGGTYCGLCHHLTAKPLYAMRDPYGSGFTRTLICEDCYEKTVPPPRWWENVHPGWYIAAAGIGSLLGGFFWRWVA